jgi:glycosyltransferase involved in cell wall biosynthesis
LTLSVVIPARNAAWCLPRCLDALHEQDPAPAEVVVVDDASTDDTALVAERGGARVVRHPVRRGVGAAWATGIEAARGDAIALVDADDSVEPGYIAALEGGFEAGGRVLVATLVPEGANAAATAVLERGFGHDLEANNGFLPAAGGAGLAVTRDVVEEVGGFDPLLFANADTDFSFRCGLAGVELTPVPDARVRCRLRTRYGDVLRQRAGRAYWYALLKWKYQRFPFAFTRERPRLVRELARAGALLAAARPRAATGALAELGIRIALHLGWVAGRLDILLLRRRPPPVLRPQSAAAARTAAPVPGRPTAILTGDAGMIARLARGLSSAPQLIAPPPGLAATAAELWDQPAPWSRRLAREARSAGWRLHVERTARRIERDAPSTWGEAYLALHGVYAAQHGQQRYVLSAPGGAGAPIGAALSEVPLVHAGQSEPPRKPAATVLDLDDPQRVLEEVAPAIGVPPSEEIASYLRLAGLVERLRLPL